MKSILLILLFNFQLFASAQQNNTRKPNVLLIVVDDLNDFIGCTGNPDAITPNIDKLAAEGVFFSNAHCPAPLCGPSRAAVLTGLRPSSTGIYGMIGDDDIQGVNELTRSTPFLHRYFKEGGYYLMGVGKVFHRHFPDHLLDESGGASGYGPFPGNRFNWNKKGTDTDWGSFPLTDEEMPDDSAVRWGVERLNRTYDKPFFLSVGLIRPHVPWYVPQKWYDLYEPSQLHLPPYLKTDRDDLPPIVEKIDNWPAMPTTEWAIENSQWRKMLQAYLACISYTDHNIGILMNALKKSAYANNTIVVLWSDHGYRMGEKGIFAKMCLWDRATRAPLIFAGPGIEKNVKVSKPVEALSIYPTLTDLCGLPKNENNEAYSLVSLLRNKNAKWNRPVITTWGRNNHSIKTDKYRYIHYEDGSEELYVLKSDPNEWNNVASKKRYANVIAQLKRFLPVINVKWAGASFYNANDYFKQQKIQQGDLKFP